MSVTVKQLLIMMSGDVRSLFQHSPLIGYISSFTIYFFRLVKALKSVKRGKSRMTEKPGSNIEKVYLFWIEEKPEKL